MYNKCEYHFVYTEERYRTNFKRETRGVGRQEEVG